MRLLITNDDGIDAPGLHALAWAMVKDGHEVVVAAPLTDMSGTGAAIGPVDLAQGVVVERNDLPNLEGVRAYGIDGPPALAVVAAVFGAFGEPPELVVSGVNPGLNTGRAVLHSGTVGAAVTAANFGVAGIAVSQDAGDPWLVGTAAAFAAAAVGWMATAGSPRVVSLNVPNVALAEVAGVREARLAPFGSTRAALGEEVGGRRQLVLRDVHENLHDDTDAALVAAGYVSVTSLVGIRGTPLVDDPQVLERAVLGGRVLPEVTIG